MIIYSREMQALHTGMWRTEERACCVPLTFQHQLTLHATCHLAFSRILITASGQSAYIWLIGSVKLLCEQRAISLFQLP